MGDHEQSQHRCVGFQRSRMRREWLLTAMVLLLAYVNLADEIRATDFRSDEARWVHSVSFLPHVLDPAHDVWQEDRSLAGSPGWGNAWKTQYLPYDQPYFASFVMSVSLILHGHDLETNGVWNYSQSYEWNRAAGNWPGDADFYALRRTSALLGAMTIAMVYSVVRLMANRIGALCAALYLVSHPLMVQDSTRVLSDPVLLALLLGATIATIRLFRHPSWPCAFLTGALLGLAAATKLSPILIAMVLAGLGGVSI